MEKTNIPCLSQTEICTHYSTENMWSDSPGVWVSHWHLLISLHSLYSLWRGLWTMSESTGTWAQCLQDQRSRKTESSSEQRLVWKVNIGMFISIANVKFYWVNLLSETAVLFYYYQWNEVQGKLHFDQRECCKNLEPGFLIWWAHFNHNIPVTHTCCINFLLSHLSNGLFLWDLIGQYFRWWENLDSRFIF